MGTDEFKARMTYEVQWTLYHLRELRRELIEAGCPLPTRLIYALERAEALAEILGVEPKDGD